jgi:hypothetical protein
MPNTEEEQKAIDELVNNYNTTMTEVINIIVEEHKEQKITCNCGKKLKKITKRHIQSKYHMSNTTDNTDIDDVLLKLAKYCIDNKHYRTDGDEGGWKHLSRKEIYDITNCNFMDSGYMFMDKECKDKEEKIGMIRLYSFECNPKWTFWTEDGEIKVDGA